MTELSVFSSIGVRSAAEELFRKFEQQNGSRLVVTWGTAPMLVARIEAGERADVLILSQAGIDTLHKQGKILSGTDVTLAGSGGRHCGENGRAEARHIHARGSYANAAQSEIHRP